MLKTNLTINSILSCTVSNVSKVNVQTEMILSLRRTNFNHHKLRNYILQQDRNVYGITIIISVWANSRAMKEVWTIAFCGTAAAAAAAITILWPPGLCLGLPGEASTRKVKSIWIELAFGLLVYGLSGYSLFVF